jgi:hypothetical protein
MMVIGSQIRVSGSASPGNSIYFTTNNYPEGAAVATNWEKNSGWFTVATPTQVFRAYDVRINASGKILFNYRIAPLTNDSKPATK